MALPTGQLIVYGGPVTGAPMGSPSSRNWTEEIEAGLVAVALALSCTVPEMTAPVAGLVRLTAGGVSSGWACSSTFTVSPSICSLVSVMLLEALDSTK